MTIHLYLLPVLHIPEGNYNVPAYFWHRLHPGLAELEGVPWAWVTYLLEDAGLLITDVTDAQHAAVIAQAGVLAIPALDNTIANTAIRNRVRSALEDVMIPGSWVQTGMTYRQVLRVVLGAFQFHNRFVALIQSRVFDGTLDLNMTVADIPLAKRERLQEAADYFGLDYSAVTGTTTIRELLRGMGAQFAATPYEIRGAGLSMVI